MASLTLEEIGKLAGVSRSTVSRVINDQPGVKSDVRERVLEVIAETGYQPNPVARSLAGQHTKIIGLVIPETAQMLFTDPYFPRLIQGIAEACTGHDYTLSLFLFHTAEDETKLTRRILRTQMFDGLIIAATYIGDPLIEQLITNDIPFVQIGSNKDTRVSFVDADNRAGAYLAVGHLVRQGYERIATITGPQNNIGAVHRKEGYLSALSDRGLSIDEKLIEQGDFTEISGYEAMQRLLRQNPDAVFVASDTMTMGAYRALHHAHIRIPEDIAIVGFDDLPPSRLLEPALTTVRQPIRRAGVHAVETLIDILDNSPEPARRIVLPTELIVRQSCGAS